jgi:hypothetical protein
MRMFLKAVVVPSASDDALKLLRRVLHGDPFRITSPEGLVSRPAGLGEAVLATMEVEAGKAGQPGPSPTMRAELLAFFASVGLGTAGNGGHSEFEPDDEQSASFSLQLAASAASSNGFPMPPKKVRRQEE